MFTYSALEICPIAGFVITTVLNVHTNC